MIKITLTKDEWRSVQLWVESVSIKKFERVSKEWFTELDAIVKPFMLSLYFTANNPEAQNIPYDSEQTLEIPRKYFRYLVVSIGLIAYNFDVKLQTTKFAYDILTKLESQGDDEWIKHRY